MAFTRAEIENAILESTGRPDSGIIRDHLGAMVDGVLAVVEPSLVTPKPVKEAKIENKSQETRVVTAPETR